MQTETTKRNMFLSKCNFVIAISFCLLNHFCTNSAENNIVKILSSCNRCHLKAYSNNREIKFLSFRLYLHLIIKALTSFITWAQGNIYSKLKRSTTLLMQKWSIYYSIFQFKKLLEIKLNLLSTIAKNLSICFCKFNPLTKLHFPIFVQKIETNTLLSSCSFF